MISKRTVIGLSILMLLTAVNIPATASVSTPESNQTNTTISTPQDVESYRAFFSDDNDTNQSVESENPNALATGIDISYPSTKPQIEINGTSMLEFRKDRLREWSQSPYELIQFVIGGNIFDALTERDFTQQSAAIQSAMTDQQVKGSSPLFMTFQITGVHGGGTPVYAGEENGIPTLGDSGVVLSHLDYGLADSVVPQDNCDPTDREDGLQYEVVENDEGETITVAVDGTQVCQRYHILSNANRTLRIGDEQRKVKGIHNGAAIRWDKDWNKPEGETPIFMTANVTVMINETQRVYDYKNGERNEKNDGHWEVVNTTNSTISTFAEQFGKAFMGRFNTPSDVDISQTVVNISENRKHVKLEINRDLPDQVALEDISKYLAITGFNISKGYTVQTGWSTYSTGTSLRSKSVIDEGLINSDLNSIYSDIQPGAGSELLRMWIFAEQRQPTIVPRSGELKNSSGLYPIKIGEFEGTNATGPYLHQLAPNVNLAALKPLLYEQVVVKNAPQRVQNGYSIHGDKIDIDTTRVVPPDIPRIKLRQVGDTIRVEVTNGTGEPIAGQKLQLLGGYEDTATTNSNGVITFKQRLPAVGVTVMSDNWDNIGERYVVKATKTQVFSMGFTLDTLVYLLIKDGLIGIAPLALFTLMRPLFKLFYNGDMDGTWLSTGEDDD